MATPAVNIPNPATPSMCCPCPSQVGCQCGNQCALACQGRTGAFGTATFCGFPEYVPSNPPIFYLAKSMGGGVFTGCGPNSQPPCGQGGPGPVCAASMFYTGGLQYSAVTCTLTSSTGMFNVTNGGSGTTCVPPGNESLPRTEISTADMTCDGVGFNFQDVFTSNTHFMSNKTCGDCVPNGSGFGVCQSPGVPACGGQCDDASMNGTNPLCSGGASGPFAILSDQDTIANAVARAVAGRPYGGTDCSVNYSFTTPYGPGQDSFAFRQSQVQGIVSEPIAGHTYQITIALMERATGSGGTLTPFGTIVVDVTAPPSGPAASAWQDIPVEYGIEIHATGCTIVDIT